MESEDKKRSRELRMLLRLKEEQQRTLKVHSDLIYTLGVYFGYPHCCNIAFCEDVLNERNTLLRRINEKGFVPCSKHYQQIKDGKISIESLIKNRCATHPYK